MTLTEVREFLANSHGRIFSVRFIKRETHTLRQMRCKTYVKDAITGEGQTYDPADYLLVNVYDMDAEHYKSFPLDGLKEIKIAGKWHKVEATQH